MMNQPTAQEIVPGPLIKRLFISEQGLRPGWSLTLFLFVYATLTLATQFSFATIPALRNWSARQPHGIISPFVQIEFTGLELLLLLVSIALTGKVEKRSFRDYGLSAAGNGRRRFLQGAVFGFGMASALMGFMAVMGGYSVSGLALDGPAIFWNGLLYGAGFFLVSFFEEFAFRGFMQTTLQRGIGMWPAGVVLSLAFGAIHLPNLGGAWVGALVAFCFGMLGVFSLQRTGNLWFIIGTHATLDWSLAFFYSTPIAGQPAQGHLLQTTPGGPDWLNGGHAGPMGSVITFAVFALGAIVIHFAFPVTENKVNDV
jgi:membrane protease YdiL (CAAX protease family)